MQHSYLLPLALLASLMLTQPAQAQVSKFHYSLGASLFQLNASGPAQANPNGYSGISHGYVTERTDATIVITSVGVGFDAPLLQFSGGEQALGVSLNASLGILVTQRQDLDGLKGQVIMDFPQYVTYRYGAKASKHAKKDFGVGIGVGYRFCRFFLPFNSPSAMLEGVYSTRNQDLFIRFSTDLRSMRFYNHYSSEGLVEAMRIREQLTIQVGSSF